MGLKNNNFIERSILGVFSFFKESVFSDEYALKKGFLQSISPPVKAISFVLFLLAILFIKTLPLLIYMHLVCILLAALSKISLVFFLKRAWVFIPLFSLFIAIPAMFSNFSPGEPLLAFRLAGIEFIITRQGLNSAILFVSRVATSVSFVILLGLVTRHNDLLRVLRIFKVPQVFVLTMGMCYRYIYLFMETIEKTYLAIKSRVGIALHYEKGQKVVAWNIASLWQRSTQLNEQVYNAMLSRGYTAEVRVLDEYRATVKDWLWLSFAIINFISVLWLITYLN